MFRGSLRCFLFLAFALGGAALAAAERRSMTPEDLWSLERVGNPAVSPDGRWAAFGVTRYSIEENKSEADLWLVATDGGSPARQITWNKGSDSNPVWSPDGKQLAFLSKRGDAPPQLYLLPMEGGGEARPLTELPVAVQDPRWFPDGKRIAFLATTWPDLNGDWKAVKKRLDERKDDKVQAKISSDRLLRFWDEYRTDGTRLHVFSVDLASREVRDLTPNLEKLFDLSSSADGTWAIAPDGKEIAFTANSTAPPFHTLNFDVYTLALEGEKPEPRNLTADNRASDQRPRYSPDGRYLIWGRNLRPEVDPDFVRLARYDRKSGQIQGLTESWDGAPEGWDFAPDSQTILFTADTRGRSHLYSLGIDGGEPKIVARGGVIAGVSAAAGTKNPNVRLVFNRRSFDAPPQIATLTLADGLKGQEPKLLTTFNAARMAEIRLGKTGEETFTGGAGDPVHMFVIYPPDFDANKKWPLLHFIHGGPYGSFQDDFHFRWNPHLAAARGYVVAMVNFHGSTGYGQAFEESILGNHGELPFADVMKATDFLLAKGFIDERRMAAAGGSYGGYLVNYILGHTDRFAALVSHAGVYDLMAQFASDAAWERPGNYGAAPWTDPAQVDRHSPSHFAPSFQTPTLVLHGEKDYRVPVTQGINLFGVLQGKGVPSRIVIFPEENHWILKPQAALLWWKEVFGWLDTYLGAKAGTEK